ncbi:MAG: hypothetical protein Q9165_005053 [Trypethelium subeluteriae]
MTIALSRLNLSGTTPALANFYPILSNYIHDPSGSALKAAQDIYDIFNSESEINEETPAPGYLWEILFWFIKQIPSNDHRQDRLVKLVSEIRNIPALSNNNACRWDSKDLCHTSWADLPSFYAVWSDHERQAPSSRLLAKRDPRIITNQPQAPTAGTWGGLPLTGIEWANLHAFLARLHAATDFRDLELRGMFALLDALEDDSPPQLADDLILAAAHWITYAGKKLKDHQIIYPPSERDDQIKRSPSSRGALYTGPPGFCGERWTFWRTRFRILAEWGELEEGTREVAARAVEEMEVLDQGQARERLAKVRSALQTR